MSARPFMQLYVSDFLGDTLHLSAEEVGAYLLMLMAMWNAGGSLPSADAKLARIARMSLKKWGLIKPSVIGFFEYDGDHITNARLLEEIQKSERKSESRSSAGEKGGRSKSLNSNKPTVAIASGLLKHSPDTRSHIPEATASQQLAPRADMVAFTRDATDELTHRLREAAGYEQNPAPNLFNVQPIKNLIAEGFGLDTEILPVIRSKAMTMTRPAQSWAYFDPIIRDARDRAQRGARDAPRKSFEDIRRDENLSKLQQLEQEWKAQAS